MENLRVITDVTEIIEIFETAINMKSTVMIWQNIDGKRTIYNGRFSKTNILNNKLTLTVTKGNHLKMDDRAIVYMRGSHKSILFKAKFLKRTRSNVIFRIPEEIKAHEFRASPRTIFTSASSRKLLFEKYSIYQSSLNVFEENLIDLSEKGLAFMTTYSTVNQFQPGDNITIAQIGDVVVAPRVEGIIVYNRPRSIVESGQVLQAYRVGVEFSEPLNKYLLEQVSQ